MNNILKVNPLLGSAIRQQFDLWYSDANNRRQSNRRKLEQRNVLSHMADDEGATALGTERDRRLKIVRKKGQGADGTGS